jgi:hypothetical protein
MPKVVPVGERKVSRTFRVSPAGDTWIDERAAAEGFVTRRGKPNRSEIIRLALASLAERPTGWRPKTHNQEGTVS